MGVATSNASEALEVIGNAKITSNVYAIGSLGVGILNPSVRLEVDGDAKIRSNVEVLGNLTVRGTTTIIDSTTVNIADNVIKVNNGATYTASLLAGIEVNRGAGYADQQFVWNETLSNWMVGVAGSQQMIATRQNAPADTTIPVYNSAARRYDAYASFVWSNNRLGVGISNPAVALHVSATDGMVIPRGTSLERPTQPLQGTIRYNTGINTFEGFGAGSAWGSLGGVKDTNQDTYISAENFPTSNDDNLVFYNSNLETMRLTKSGRVGIGKSNPEYKLDMVGDMGIDGSVNANRYVLCRGIQVQTRTASTFSNVTLSTGIVTGYSNDGLGITLFVNSNNDTNYLRFIASNNELFRVTGVGRLGVGTSNPSERLEVNGNAKVNGILNLISSNANAAVYTDYSNNTSRAIAGLDGSNFTLSTLTNNDITLTTNQTERMRILANGRIGIGTSNPTDTLNISGGTIHLGNGTVNGESVGLVLTATGSIRGSMHGNLHIVSRANGAGEGVYFFQSNAGYTQFNKRLMFMEGTTGNITMGANAPPNKKLVVGDNSNVAGQIMIYSQDGDKLYFTHEDTAAKMAYVNSNLGFFAGNTATATSNGSLTFYTSEGNAWSKRMEITPSGNVEVSGGAKINSNMEVVGDLTVRGTTTTINSTTVNIQDNIIRINNAAAFNSSLQAGLEINRGTGYSNYMMVFDETTQYFRTGQQGTLQTVATRDDSPVSHGVMIYDAANRKLTACNSLAFSNNRLGVATTSPLESLHVASGKILASANQILGYTGDTALVPAYSWGDDSNTGLYHPAADTIAFTNNGTESIRIDSVGNVGVGKTNPGVRLDVNGTLNATTVQQSGSNLSTILSSYATTTSVSSSYVTNTAFASHTHNLTSLDGTLSISKGGTGTATIPVFSAYRSGAAITIADKANVEIIFNNTLFNVSSAYSTSTGRFTPSVAGYYLCTWCVLLVGMDTVGEYEFFSYIRKNQESTFYQWGTNHTPNRTFYSASCGSCVVYLNGSDYVSIYAYQDSDASKNIVSDIASMRSTFTGVLVRTV
jgi:hypothetical protein